MRIGLVVATLCVALSVVAMVAMLGAWSPMGSRASAQTAATPAAPATTIPTPTITVVPPVQPEPGAAPGEPMAPTVVAPLPPSVHHVVAGDQIGARPADVNLGTDGTYQIPDRGDGCSYREVARLENGGKTRVVLQSLNCEVFFRYEPATGQLTAWVQ